MFGLHSMCEAQVDFGDVTVLTKSGAEEIWHELVVVKGELATVSRSFSITQIRIFTTNSGRATSDASGAQLRQLRTCAEA